MPAHVYYRRIKGWIHQLNYFSLIICSVWLASRMLCVKLGSELLQRGTAFEEPFNGTPVLILPSNSFAFRKKWKCTGFWLLENGFPTYILSRFYSPEHLLWSCVFQKCDNKHFKLYFTIYLELIHSKWILLFQTCK